MSSEASERVQVYTGDFCGYCMAAKRFLSSKEIPFVETNVSQVEGARDALVARTGWRTIPVIEIDGELIGGYTELVAFARNGGLEKLGLA